MNNHFLSRVSRDTIHKTVAAVLTLTLCLAANSPVSGQTTIPGNPADPTRTIIPVHLDATTGAITVGRVTYPGGIGVHVLALQRQPQQPPNPQDMPAVLNDQVFSDGNLLIQTFRNLLNNPATKDALIIVNAFGGYGFGPATFAAELEGFGGQVDLEKIKNVVPFQFIGNGGLGKGGAFQRGFSTRPVDGYLAPDSNGNYKFVQTDYVSYDITTDGTIKVGNKTYKAADAPKATLNGQSFCDAAGSNSFHLVVVDRESPDILILDKVYCTGASLTLARELSSQLNQSVIGANTENLLVFIASNGKPIPSTVNFSTSGDVNMVDLATAIDALGGYYETVVYLGPNDTFSFVGAPAPGTSVLRPRSRARESSSVYPSHPSGELHGVLARGRGNWYSPLNADPSGRFNLGLYGIMALPPTPFPHPVASDQAEMTAFKNISTSLCKLNPSSACPSNWNIRDQYSNAVAAIADYYNALTVMKDPVTGADCANPLNTGSAFCVVRQQILSELFAVTSINALESSLDTLLTDIGVNDSLGLTAASNSIQATLPNLSPSASVPNAVGSTVSFALGVAAEIPVIGPIFGVADAMFNYAKDMTTDSTGTQTVSLSSSIADLARQTQNQFTAQKSALGTQFDTIRQDWGKLSALGTSLGTATSGSAWYWDRVKTEAAILQGLTPAINQSFYQSLMSSIYAIGLYKPACPITNPSCGGVAWGELPLSQQPANYWAIRTSISPPSVDYRLPFVGYQQYTYPGDPAFVSNDLNPTQTLLAANGWQGISLQSTPREGDVNGKYDPPAQSLMRNLFAPVSQGGMGVYRVAFFEGWSFPRVNCGDSLAGCHWSAAAPALEAVAKPVEKLSFSVNFISRNGSKQTMELTIHNSGTKDFTSVQLNGIGVRTLAGRGQANLQDPAFPIQLGSIKKGAFAKLTLTLVIPPNVQRLEFTETGVAETGEKAPYSFNLSQIINP